MKSHGDRLVAPLGKAAAITRVGLDSHTEKAVFQPAAVAVGVGLKHLGRWAKRRPGSDKSPLDGLMPRGAAEPEGSDAVADAVPLVIELLDDSPVIPATTA